MSGTQYNIALSVFFIPYTLAGVFSSYATLLSDLVVESLQRYQVTPS